LQHPTTNEWQKIGDSTFTIENIHVETQCIASLQSHKIYITGAITDQFFKHINTKKNHNTHIIANDFTKLFITPQTYDKFHRNGGKISVLQKAKLLAVCTNPTSPEGASFDPETLRSEMQNALGVSVYDVVMENETRLSFRA